MRKQQRTGIDDNEGSFDPYLYLLQTNNEKSISLHELIHWWSIISSNTGLLQLWGSHIFVKSIDLFVKELLRHPQTLKSFKLPLILFKPAPKYSEKVIQYWQRSKILFETINRYMGKCQTPKHCSEISNPWSILGSSKKSECPILSDKKGHLFYPVGFSMLSESLSTSIEMLYNSDLKKYHQLQKKVAIFPQYSLLENYAEHELGPDYLFSYLIILDLSLMSPDPRKDTAAYEEIHPGWRFFKAINAVKELNLKITSIHEHYQTLVKKIEEKLQWQSWQSNCRRLREVAIEIEDASKSEIVGKATRLKYSALNKIIIRAYRYRKKYPGIFAYPFPFLDELKRELMPPIIRTGSLLLYPGRKRSTQKDWISSHAMKVSLMLQLYLSREIKCFYILTGQEEHCRQRIQDRPCVIYPTQQTEYNRCGFVKYYEEILKLPTWFHTLEGESPVLCSKCSQQKN